MYYLLLLIISFTSVYLLTKTYETSLFVSLTVLVLVTAFNYDDYIGVPIILCVLAILIYVLKLQINTINFLMLNYIFLSILELAIHKNVMHCDKNGLLSSIVKYIPVFNDEYECQCDSHIQHHVEVEPDMSLNSVDDEKSLFMYWRVFILFFILLLVCTTMAKHISNYNIGFKYLLIISGVVTFVYEYLWNKVHHKMHEYYSTFSILEGPYDNGLFNLDIVKNMLYNNHKNHHLQKGTRKGNYNIIVLGADEWFGLHTQKVDNIEYCKTHRDEKICM